MRKKFLNFCGKWLPSLDLEVEEEVEKTRFSEVVMVWAEGGVSSWGGNGGLVWRGFVAEGKGSEMLMVDWLAGRQWMQVRGLTLL